jgi:hypothetical protein
MIEQLGYFTFIKIYSEMYEFVGVVSPVFEHMKAFFQNLVLVNSDLFIINISIHPTLIG